MVLVQIYSVLTHISFEPLAPTLQGIDHAPCISGSMRNQAQQLLRLVRSRDGSGAKHNRHSLAFPRDYTWSQNAVILVQTYSVLTYLFRTTDVNVTRYRSCPMHLWFDEKPSATIIEISAFKGWKWHKS